MKPLFFRQLPKLLPLAALFLASGIVQAAQPPRVMFVSGVEAQPVLIDLQGKETPAKKGAIIPPGFSVKVPEGATMQIMTDEKAIVAVRQNSLLKLEKLGDGNEPHKFKLDAGGLRVATPDNKPKKFEVDTPNAKLTFDRGDHEAYFLPESKQTDGQWGTMVRGLKESSVLTTAEGATSIDTTLVGYVPGSPGGKLQLIDRGSAAEALRSSGTGPASTLLLINQKILASNIRDGGSQSGSNSGTVKDPSTGSARGGFAFNVPGGIVLSQKVTAETVRTDVGIMTAAFSGGRSMGSSSAESSRADFAAINTSVAAPELNNPAMMGTTGSKMLAVVAKPAFSNTLSRGTVTSTTTPKIATTLSTANTPKDIYLDPVSKTPVLLVGDKLSIPTRTLADANKLQPVSLKDIPPATKSPAPVAGTPIVTKEQQISTISKTLSTRTLKLR